MRRHASVIVILALALLSAPDHATAAELQHLRTLSLHGLKPVKLGMSIEQAEKALRAKLQPRALADEESVSCWYTRRVDGLEPDISYMINDNRVVRIDIDQPQDQKFLPAKSRKGVGIGATEKNVTDLYGTSVKIAPHPYTDGHYLRIPSRNGRKALLFETEDGIVTSLRVGLAPQVDYIEGCL